MNDQDLSLKILVVLSKTYKSVMATAARDMKKYGLSETEFSILELLYHKGRFPLQQIGDKVLITSGSITYNVDKLENKGYLQRVSCQEDRRIIYAEMTDAGKKLFDECFPLHAKEINSIMSDLSEKEKHTVIELLKKIGKNA